MEYLHHLKPPVVHGDLKSDNLLVTKEFKVKLCDFGSATREGTDYGCRMPFTFHFVPPEAWEEGNKYKPRTTFDVYSFAVLMLEVISGNVPYGDLDAVLVEFHVTMGNRFPLNDLETPAEVNDLIQDCWKQDCDQRPSFQGIRRRLENVLETPDVERAIQQCYRWLQINPEKPPKMRPYILVPILMNYWTVPHEQYVTALSLLGRELFAVFESSSIIQVFDMQLKNIRNFEVVEMKQPWDITTCRTDKCLYILEWNVTVLAVDSVSGVLVRRWNFFGGGTSIYINKKNNILLTCSLQNTIKEYTRTGKIVRKLFLSKATNKLIEKLKQWRNDGIYELDVLYGIGGLSEVNDGYIVRFLISNKMSVHNNFFQCHISRTGKLLHHYPDIPYILDADTWKAWNSTMDDRQQLICSDGSEENRIRLFTDHNLRYPIVIRLPIREQMENYDRFQQHKIAFHTPTGLLYATYNNCILSFKLM